MILSTDLISWLADQQLIFQINAWLARAEVLSIDLSNKYLTGPSQISVLWSFRYVMPKYCQLIFLINTWLAWAKILSADLSYKDKIVDKNLIGDRLFIGDIWHTLRYRSYFSATVHKNLKIKMLKNCFKSLFPICRIFFYIYLDHIMQKKYKLFVTCDMSQPCNMSHFEKIENSGMNCGVK